MSGSIEVMQVRDNCIVVYHEQMFSRRYANKRASRFRMKEARKGQYSGKMTVGTRKRMVKAITLMCQVAGWKTVYNEVTKQHIPHRMSFVTLTVSNSKNMTAKQGYKLLAPFLQWLRRDKGVKTYVWKAELQERGQLHYHITTPHFIPWQDIRAEWNRIQKNAGLLDEFAEKYGHVDPNSTDIHETKQVRNMASYIVKELAKSMQNETETQGKLWDCSSNLSAAKYFSVLLSVRHDNIIEKLRGTKAIREVVGDFWSIVYFSDASPPDILLDESERKRFEQHLQGITRDRVEEEPEVIAMPAVIESVAPLTWKPLELSF